MVALLRRLRRGPSQILPPDQSRCVVTADGQILLLWRENEQRRIEGSRAARTQHGSKIAMAECNTRAHAVLHSNFVFCVPCDQRPVHVPSDFCFFAARRAGAPTVGSSARCRCKCARSTPLIPQSNLLQLRPINSRVLLILLICRLIHSTPCVRVTHSTGRTRLSR